MKELAALLSLPFSIPQELQREHSSQTLAKQGTFFMPSRKDDKEHEEDPGPLLCGRTERFWEGWEGYGRILCVGGLRRAWAGWEGLGRLSFVLEGWESLGGSSFVWED